MTHSDASLTYSQFEETAIKNKNSLSLERNEAQNE